MQTYAGVGGSYPHTDIESLIGTEQLTLSKLVEHLPCARPHSRPWRHGGRVIHEPKALLCAGLVGTQGMKKVMSKGNQ